MKKVVLLGLLLVGVGVGYELSRLATLWRSRSIINTYIASNQIRKLQLGAGGVKLEGWLSTDIEPGPGEVYLDATKRFPVPDASIHYIFGEHVIEHLTYNDGMAMLRECYRVLDHGGKVRFATPDLRRLTSLLEKAPPEYLEEKFRFHGWPAKDPSLAPAFIINMELRNWGHQFVYDEVTLRDSLARAGFSSIQRFEPGTSDDNALSGIEARHNKPEVRPMNDFESMVLQAIRR